MPPKSTKEALEAKRSGFDEELEWHKFLLDAYTGGGGFQGRVRQEEAGFWGYAAEAYSVYATLNKAFQEQSSSYLDQFDREDTEKFRRRRNVAHYLNYVEPTTAIKIGYICRKPHKRNNVPDQIEQWIEDSGWDEGFRRRALVTAVLGWFPMLVDMPRKPEVLTEAQAGKLDPYTVLSLPCHLLDYGLDERGEQFEWAKMGTCYTRKESWEAEPVEVKRYTIWTRADFTVFEMVGDVISEPVRGTHPFKQVPIVSWRADTTVEDAVKSKSINGNIALEGRRLFNLVSELDEHIRGQVFALLMWPDRAPAGNEAGAEVGTKNGLIFDGSKERHPPFYLAPPAEVAATLEKRLEATIIEIYRMAGVEYERASGTQSSAQSREREFAKTNVSIAALAASLARSDRETLILVGRGMNVDEAKLQKIECVAHESYADEALGEELEQAMNALTIAALGRRVKVELLKRLSQKLLPGMSSDTRKEVDSEIEEAVDQQAKDEELAKEALAAGSEPDGGGGDGSEQDGDEEEQPEAAE